jgi:hypothetical protein
MFILKIDLKVYILDAVIFTKEVDKMLFVELDIFKKQAENGEIQAQYFLGECYLYGYGTEVDVAQSVHWFEMAAEQDNVEAQWQLANIYENGCEAVPQDLQKAFYWYDRSANNGYAVAQHFLGKLYYNGTGCEKNLEKAIYWFKKAVEQGSDASQVYLDKCNQEIKNPPLA